MRLAEARIAELSSGPGVDPVPVQNFLSSLEGLSFQEAKANLDSDAVSLGWSRETYAAIWQGILDALGPPRSGRPWQEIMAELVRKAGTPAPRRPAGPVRFAVADPVHSPEKVKAALLALRDMGPVEEIPCAGPDGEPDAARLTFTDRLDPRRSGRGPRNPGGG